MMNKPEKNSFHAWLDEEMRDPEFRKMWEDRDLADRICTEIAHMRRRNGITQAQLARKMRTCQEVVSRLENGGRGGVTVKTLERVAKALGKKLDIKFV